MRIGHHYEDSMSVFTVWSNKNKNLKIEFPETGKLYFMQNIENGYFQYRCEKLSNGTKYKFILDNGNSFPDPASKSQPDGVHSYSVVDGTINNSKPADFNGVDLSDAVIYELHIGTFTTEGTIKAAKNKISYLKELGVNCVSIMPLASFPGKYNWGYDGVFQFAIDSTYGAITDFIEFINECNKNGIGVILDIVYNHLGPEGNYLSQYASYFTKRFATPWGSAISYDGRYSKHVKNYFMENIRFWLEDMKIDGFRMDSPGHMYDYSDKHIINMIVDYARKLEQKEERIINIISEHPYHKLKSKGRVEMDAHWQDDFHHAFHSYFTDETNVFNGKYGDFEQIKHMFKLGYCSEFWKTDYYKEAHKLLAFIHSHDQAGNRPDGKRYSSLVTYAQYKLSVFAMFVSPFTPMLFMGEEYYETNPFFYFCDFNDEKVRKGVRNGRRKELKKRYKTDIFSDPLSKDTFIKSKLDFDKLKQKKHRNIFEFYKLLIYLRKTKFIGSSNRSDINMEFDNENKIIIIKNIRSSSTAILNFSNKTQELQLNNTNTVILDSKQKYDFKEFINQNKTDKIRNIRLDAFGFILLHESK